MSCFYVERKCISIGPSHVIIYYMKVQIYKLILMRRKYCNFLKYFLDYMCVN